MRKNYTPTYQGIKARAPFKTETDEEWQGNKPYWQDTSYHGISIVNQDTNEPFILDRWSCRFGSGWTYTENDVTKFPCFEFTLDDSICIDLITPITRNEPTLFINRITSGSVWKYNSDLNQFSKVKIDEPDIFQPLNQDQYEYIKCILNTKIDNCYIWDKFQAKCIEIFDGLNQGNFIDYLKL